MYYAAYNSYADIDRGDRGFCNTWVIVRTKTKAERAEFVSAFENQNAREVTREKAEYIYERNFAEDREKMPAGGLFRRERDWSGNTIRRFVGMDWIDGELQEAA